MVFTTQKWGVQATGSPVALLQGVIQSCRAYQFTESVGVGDLAWSTNLSVATLQYGATVGHHSTTSPRYEATTVPWQYGTGAPWQHGATLQQYGSTQLYYYGLRHGDTAAQSAVPQPSSDQNYLCSWLSSTSGHFCSVVVCSSLVLSCCCWYPPPTYIHGALMQGPAKTRVLSNKSVRATD